MLLEGIVHHFPIDDIISGVGSLHYSQEERKKLAELSHKWKCEICGKHFSSERYIDKHFEVKHMNSLQNVDYIIELLF